MGVGRQDMNAPLVQHSIRPVLRSSAESASERAGRNLHPYTDPNQPLNCFVAGWNPRQPFWMGENRDKARYKQAEKKVFQMRGFSVVRRLDQNIT